MATPHVGSGEVVSLPGLCSDVMHATTQALMKSRQLEIVRIVLHAGKNLPVHQVEGELTFKLLTTTLEQLLKAAAVMKLKELEITDKGLRAFNKNSTGNQYDVGVEDLEGSATPKVIKIENIKLLPRDYNVVVGERAIKFTTIDGDLEYIIAIETE